MYCPKCGKQVPDNTAFCSNCGANLQGRATNSGSKSEHNSMIVGLIVGFISVLLLIRGWPVVEYWKYIDFDKLQYYPEVQMRLLCLILGVTGVICGIIIAVRSANEIADNHQKVSPYTFSEPHFTETPPPKKAIKTKMKNLKGLVKCSRCGKVQAADRTVCQSCGAEFINR